MPEQIRKMPILDFYRYIGCDILQSRSCGLGLPDDLFSCKLVTPEVQTEKYAAPGGLEVMKQKTPLGTLTSTFMQGHPVKYPVESIEDARILKNIWINSRYEETPVGSTEINWGVVDKEVGESGICYASTESSAIQHLLQWDMGVINFYYLLQDHREEMEELFAVMHQCRLAEWEIIARRSPVDILMPTENTSSTLISPSIYASYSLPQIRDFVGVAHKYGKKAILHMCGHLKQLLPIIKETGLDGINGLTPPPVGDTPFEYALDMLGDETIILGGVFDPTVLQKPVVTAKEIADALEKIFTSRIRSSHFVLWVPADGQPLPLERFLAVRDWMERNG